MSRIGCAWSATSSQTPMVSNSRRAAAAIAEARPVARRPAERRIGDDHLERLAQRLPQRDRQRQPGKAAAADQDIGGRTLAAEPLCPSSGRPHGLRPSARPWLMCSASAQVAVTVECTAPAKHLHAAANTAVQTCSPSLISNSLRSICSAATSPQVGLAAGVRRPGDRPGAGRSVPHRREHAAAFAARLFPARRRSEGADRLRRRPHPRRQELHHAARGRDPARPGDLLDVGVVPQRRAGLEPSDADAGRAAPGRAAERRRDQSEDPAADARGGAPLLRAASGRSSCARWSSAATPARSTEGAVSTSGCAPPRRCPTIRRSIAARWPMPRT